MVVLGLRSVLLFDIPIVGLVMFLFPCYSFRITKATIYLHDQEVEEIRRNIWISNKHHLFDMCISSLKDLHI